MNEKLKSIVLFLAISIFFFPSLSQASSIAGDLNGDYRVDIDDLAMVASNWMESGSIPANFDGQGNVDIADFAILAGNWGKFIENGTLVVNISPQAAIDAGGQWRVNGGAWYDSSSEFALVAGVHTVEFSSVPAWQTPGSVQVEIFQGTQVVISKDYLPIPSVMLQINEFMADNDSRSPLGPGNILDGDLMSSDWIEKYNNSDSPIDISGKYLTDDSSKKTKWQFPSGMSQLQPRDFLIVFASGKTQAENPDNYPYFDGSYFHTNLKLSSNGEYLGLIDADGLTVIHEYKYPDQEENFSYGLYDSDTSYFSQATPGAANADEFVAFVEKPDVSIEGGCYENAVDVAITCDTVDSIIRYTTDATQRRELFLLCG